MCNLVELFLQVINMPQKNISLATSKLYTLGANGYGNVFCFYSDALGIFDQMGGVDITL